jgi:hypothetical protein
MGAAQFIVWSVALGRAKETEIQNRGRRFGPPLSRKRNQIVCAMLAGGASRPRACWYLVPNLRSARLPFNPEVCRSSGTRAAIVHLMSARHSRRRTVHPGVDLGQGRESSPGQGSRVATLALPAEHRPRATCARSMDS